MTINVGRSFKNGLLAIIPTSLSLYAVYWVCTTAEGLLAEPLKQWLGTRPRGGYYFPGLGMAVGVCAVFLVGLALDFWFARILFRWGERLVAHIPLIKTLYGSLKDLTAFFAGDRREGGAQRMVLVRVFDHGKLIGMVTRDEFDEFARGIVKPGEIAVFVPFSYAMGGYTLLVPRERVEPLSCSVEEGMKLAATAWMAMAGTVPGPTGFAAARTLRKAPDPSEEAK